MRRESEPLVAALAEILADPQEANLGTTKRAHHNPLVGSVTPHAPLLIVKVQCIWRQAGHLLVVTNGRAETVLEKNLTI